MTEHERRPGYVRLCDPSSGLESGSRGRKTPERKSLAARPIPGVVATLAGCGALYVGVAAPLGLWSGAASFALVLVVVGALFYHPCDHEWLYPQDHGKAGVRWCPNCERSETWRSRHPV